MNERLTCNDCGHEEVVPVIEDTITFSQEQGKFVCDICGSGDVSIEPDDDGGE